MTTTARTAPKFCANIRAERPEMFALDLNYYGISGIIEPWSECLPERIKACRKTSSKVGFPIALFTMCDTFAYFFDHHRLCVEIHVWTLGPLFVKKLIIIGRVCQSCVTVVGNSLLN